MDVKRLLKSDRIEFIFNRHRQLVKIIRKKGKRIIFYTKFHIKNKEEKK